MTKSRTLRKAGAVVLSLAMAFSVAGVAPSADAAAKKPALSAKKGTIKVGKKKTVKVKNTTAKKVKKLVVSSSNKKVATVKKKSKVKFTVTGKKAGKATITAKVTLKKAVAKKKVYTLKYTATVKKAATTPTEAPVVAVTGVTLSNSTPKVGDTISASVTPSNATNVTYQWLADDAVIAGATSATYTVAETDLGKQLSVTVQGDNNSTATSQKTAKVEAKEAADFTVSAKQTHAKVIEVTYTTGSPSADSKYVVTKGAQEAAVASSTTKDNVVTLTMKENLTDGDYKVEVTTSADKKAEATFTGQKPVLTTVKFSNNNLSVSANTTKGMVKGYAHIDSVDQFGDHMNLTSPSFTVSKGDASFKADTGILTLDASNTADKTYKLGEMVVVSVMYDNNTKVVPATLTVTTAAMAKTITFGDLTSDDTKAYPVDKITQTNLGRGVYWFPVTEAKDDADLPLDADRLNDMIDAQTVFVTPKEGKGTIIYADKFTEKTVDGKKVIALVVKGGDQLNGLNASVDMQLSVFSVGGAQATLPVKITRDAVIKDLNIDIPELYIGKESEIKLSAADTDGNKVDLYKVTSNVSLAKAGDPVAGPVTLTASEQSAELRFWDTAQGTNAIGTKINISTGSINCKWSLVRNATNHEVSLKVTPIATAGADEGYLNMTGTTAAYTAITKANIKINKTRQIDGVSGFAGGISTKVLNTNDTEQVLSGNNTVLTLNDGSTTGAADGGATFVRDKAGALEGAASAVDTITIDGAGAAIDAVTDPKYFYTMEMVGVTATGTNKETFSGDAFTLTRNTDAKIQVNSTAATGKSNDVKISLYKLSKIDSPVDSKDIKVEKLGTKTVTFIVENENTAKYVLALGAEGVLYAGRNHGFGENWDTLSVSIKTEAGAAVQAAKLKSVKVVNKNNDGATFDFNGAAIYCVNKSNKPAGQKMTATINAVVENNGDTVEVSKDFTYQTDDPVVTSVGLFSNAAFTAAINDNKANVKDDVIGDDDDDKAFLKYQDQYGTEAQSDGISVDVTVANDKTGAAKLEAYYDEGKLCLTGSGTITAGKTFQLMVNGGIPITVYCTTTSAVTLTAAGAVTTGVLVNDETLVNNDLSGLSVTLESAATGAGKLYLSKNGTSEDVLLKSFTQGATSVALTGLTNVSGIEAGKDYKVIAVPDNGWGTPIASTNTWTASDAKLKTATATASTSALTIAVTNAKDQFGNAFTFTNGAVATADTNVTATISNTSTAGACTITIGGSWASVLSDNDIVTFSAFDTVGNGILKITLDGATTATTVAAGDYDDATLTVEP